MKWQQHSFLLQNLLVITFGNLFILILIRLIFNCEKCNYQFDIDGWFYQFETIQCPHCNTIFSGYFGKVLPGSKNDNERAQKSVLKLESFDDQEFEIQLSSNTNVFAARQDHIVLVVFSKPKDGNSKPWCWFDWSTKNSKAQYFRPQLTTAPINQEKTFKKEITINDAVYPFRVVFSNRNN